LAVHSFASLAHPLRTLRLFFNREAAKKAQREFETSFEVARIDSSVDYCYIFTAFYQKSPLFSVPRGDFTGQGRTP
jgi:hypothetical protein